MPKKKITLTVSATGAITAEAHGPGTSCTDDLKAIQALLPDAVITDSRLTPAYFQQSVTDQTSQYENEADPR